MLGEGLLFPSSITFKSASVKSKTFSILYHKRIVIQNDFSEEEFREPIDCSQLLYDNQYQESSHVNIAIDPVLSQGPQCILNEAPALNFLSSPRVDDDDIINIQLPYDPNQPMEPEL